MNCLQSRTIRFDLIFLFFSIFLKANGQWIPTNGPTGGNASCFVSVNQYLFAGKSSASSSNGVYRTDNLGNSWTNVINNGPSGNIVNMARIGTSVFAVQGNQVYLTQDFGLTWSNVSSGLPSQPLKGMATRNNDIFVGATRIYKSINLGLSWQLLANSPIGSVNDIVILNDTIYSALSNGQVHRSLNYGQSWTNISNGLPNTSINALLVRGQTLFAGTSVGLYKSTNSGNSWSAITSPISNVGEITERNGVIFMGGVGGICISYNDGQTWFQINDGLTFNTLVGPIGFDQNNVYVGNGNTVVHRRPLSDIMVISTDSCNVTIYDTTFVTINDTVLNNVYDTVYTTVYDTVYSTIFDTITTTIYDTLYTYITDTTFYSVADTLLVNFSLTGGTTGNIETLKIYPNPASTMLNIENLNFLAYQNYTLEIQNNLGQSVFYSSFTQPAFVIDLSLWSGPGVYYLRVYDPSSNSLLVRKIILQ